VKVQLLSRFLYCKEQIIPGVADYYATCFDGFDFANLLVKTREVVLSKLTIILSQELDFPNARIHASILSLYDNLRLKQPKIGGKGHP
jgi:molybdopterin-containing oxidoreductase family iron-sulfur binding subunit